MNWNSDPWAGGTAGLILMSLIGCDEANSVLENCKLTSATAMGRPCCCQGKSFNMSSLPVTPNKLLSVLQDPVQMSPPLRSLPNFSLQRESPQEADRKDQVLSYPSNRVVPWLSRNVICRHPAPSPQSRVQKSLELRHCDVIIGMGTFPSMLWCRSCYYFLTQMRKPRV